MSILQPHKGYNIAGYDPHTSPVMYPFKWRGCLVRPLTDSAAIMHYLGHAYNDLQKAKRSQAELVGGTDVVVSARAFPWVSWHVMSIAGNDILTIWVPPPEVPLEEVAKEPKLLTNLEYFVAWDIVKATRIISATYQEMDPSEYLLIQDVRMMHEYQIEDTLAMAAGFAAAGLITGFVSPMVIGELEPTEVISRKYLEHMYPHWQGWELFATSQESSNYTNHAPDLPNYPDEMRPCLTIVGGAHDIVAGWMYSWDWTYTLAWPYGSIVTHDFWSDHLTGGGHTADIVYNCPEGMHCFACREALLKPTIGPNTGTRVGGWDRNLGIYSPQTKEKGEYDVFIISEDTPYVKYLSPDPLAHDFGAVSEDGDYLLLGYTLLHDWDEDWSVREYFIRCSVGANTYEWKYLEDHVYSEAERMDFEAIILECTIYEAFGSVWFLLGTLRREFPWDDSDGEEYFLQYHIITYGEVNGWQHHKSREFQGSLRSMGSYGSVESIDGVTNTGWIPFTYIDPDTKEEATGYNTGTFRLVKMPPSAIPSAAPL